MEMTNNHRNDQTIIAWRTDPPPNERYVLIRYMADGEQESAMAWVDEDGRYCDPGGWVLRLPVEAWAFMPYDRP